MPLRGVPLVGVTGLRLLIASNPPLLLDVDRGRSKRIGGLNVRGNPVLSVLAVGRHALVWLHRRVPVAKNAEIYLVRQGSARATRLASALEVAASADGAAIWLKSYTDARRCTLRELGLDGRQRQSPRAVPCSIRLIDTGAGALIVQDGSAVDPETGRALLQTADRTWARAGHFLLTVAGSQGPLALTDVRSGERRLLSYPSKIGGQGGVDQAAVQRNGGQVALSFSDPAFELTGTQVTDVWLLDPAARAFHHLPDMPAAVSLKSTSMSWTSDGRLILLAQTAGRDVVAAWQPGQERIAVRRVRLPARWSSGSDSFVAWP